MILLYKLLIKQLTRYLFIQKCISRCECVCGLYVVCVVAQPKAEVGGFRNLDRLGAAEVARRTVDLLPTLCQHTESTSAFFQVLFTFSFCFPSNCTDVTVDLTGSGIPSFRRVIFRAVERLIFLIALITALIFYA